MGIETDADYDGANCSFTSAIITIEGEFESDLYAHFYSRNQHPYSIQ